jgi:8-oxo-dGTP pyrophosphatase MutT (NUDIX family)
MQHTLKCDHTSVGALIYNARGELLMFERGTFPYGIAGPAGHCDGDSYEDALMKEVSEEVGLTVVSQRLVASFCVHKACRREFDDTPYHDWRFYRAVVEGDIQASKRETKRVRWYAVWQIQQAMRRAEEYHLLGMIDDAHWQQWPGLDHPWYRLFNLHPELLR